MRHFDVVEKQKSIIHGVVAKLWSNVANVDILKRFMCPKVTYLDDKWVWPVRFPIDDELRHYDGVVGRLPEGPDPPFAGSEVGRMNDECLVRWIPRCKGLESTHIGPMAELCLSVAANYFVVICFGEELFVLLRGALFIDSHKKHAVMKSIGPWFADEFIRRPILI